jgi:hypothetical protein
MAMATLERLTRATWMDDAIAFGAGALDGYLLDKVPVAFLIKNVGVPIASLFVRGIPDGLKKESEGMLGLAVYVLLTGGK